MEYGLVSSNKQTDRQTDTLIATHCTPYTGEVMMQSSQYKGLLQNYKVKNN